MRRDVALKFIFLLRGEYMAYIYRIIHEQSRTFYVGQTQQKGFKRISDHFKDVANNKPDGAKDLILKCPLSELTIDYFNDNYFGLSARICNSFLAYFIPSGARNTHNVAYSKLKYTFSSPRLYWNQLGLEQKLDVAEILHTFHLRRCGYKQVNAETGGQYAAWSLIGQQTRSFHKWQSDLLESAIKQTGFSKKDVDKLQQAVDNICHGELTNTATTAWGRFITNNNFAATIVSAYLGGAKMPNVIKTLKDHIATNYLTDITISNIVNKILSFQNTPLTFALIVRPSEEIRKNISVILAETAYHKTKNTKTSYTNISQALQGIFTFSSGINVSFSSSTFFDIDISTQEPKQWWVFNVSNANRMSDDEKKEIAVSIAKIIFRDKVGKSSSLMWTNLFMTGPQRAHAMLFGFYRDDENRTLSQKLRTGFLNTGFKYSFIENKTQWDLYYRHMIPLILPKKDLIVTQHKTTTNNVYYNKNKIWTLPWASYKTETYHAHPAYAFSQDAIDSMIHRSVSRIQIY